MEIFNDKLFEEFKNKLNSGESILEYMSKSGCDTSSGRNNFYRCVFHEDKTPSMSVNDKKGVFHCFSCGRGGKYFDFVYQYNKIILGYKKSQKDFANELISKDKSIRKKYGIESLDKKIKFSSDTIKYIMEVKKISKSNRREISKRILDGDENVENSEMLNLEKRLKNTKDKKEILEIFAKIQKGNLGGI